MGFIFDNPQERKYVMTYGSQIKIGVPFVIQSKPREVFVVVPINARIEDMVRPSIIPILSLYGNLSFVTTTGHYHIRYVGDNVEFSIPESPQCVTKEDKKSKDSLKESYIC